MGSNISMTMFLAIFPMSPASRLVNLGDSISSTSGKSSSSLPLESKDAAVSLIKVLTTDPGIVI